MIDSSIDDPGETFSLSNDGDGYTKVVVRFRNPGSKIEPQHLRGIDAREEFVGYVVSMTVGFVPALEPFLLLWLKGFASQCAKRRRKAQAEA